MAEAVGLALGTVSLATVFSTCIECLEYFDAVQAYGRDFEESMTKILLLKARLVAWGDSMEVMNPGRETAVLRERWTSAMPVVERALIGISGILENARNVNQKYGLDSIGENHGDEVGVSPGPASREYRQLEHVFRVKWRQERTSTWKKTVWAVRDKGKIESLISSLNFYIDNLEKLADRLQMLDRQTQFLHATIQQVTTPRGIALLERTEADLEALSTESQARDDAHTILHDNIAGHRYIGTMIADRARVINGDVGIVGSHSRHVYERTHASGDAQVVQGDTSGDFAMGFFR